MKYQEKIKDPMLSQRVTETLSNMGLRAPCRVAVVSNKGNVTLSGTIQYEHQRHIALHAIRAVTGVQRVVDQMRVIPKGQRWQTNIKR
jgi:osmotically-inducible protein OsmY